MAAERVGAGEFTLGVEEEYQLIDPDTRALRPSSLSVLPQAHPDVNERIQPELHTSQIEIGTPICRDLVVADAVVEIMNRARAWIPPLLALAASSPYWYGADTGYASFRTEIVRRWPLSDVPHRFGSRAEYEALVQDLVASGCIEGSNARARAM